MKYEALFTPIKIRGLELKNRIVLPGMMTKMATPRTGEITQTLIDYHVAKVKGGCALNITGAVAIDETTNGLGYLALYEPYHKFGWKRLADAIHEEGGKLCAQIWHGGYVNTLLEDDQNPMVTNDMTKEDIEYIIGRYANSTKMAVESGVDAIQLHAAHYYLIHTFLSSAWNKRDDEYNGSLENRAKFPLEVIEAMRSVMPEDMPLIMRVNCFDDVPENDGLTIEEVITFINWAEEKGVDLVDVSRGNGSSGLIYEVPSIETPRGYNIENFSKIKKGVNIPVMGVGRINDPKMANDIIKNGHADLVAIGRAQIVDSEFANKAMRGEDEKIRKCVACNTGCFDAIVNPSDVTITCLRNPLVGKEGKKIEKTDSPKNVLVVGAGLGGLTAASMLKIRGHNPMVYEASDGYGGQFVLAGQAPGLGEMVEAVEWEGRYAEDLGIKTNFNTKVTPELIEKLKPDEVIIATGGSPTVPKIKGVDNKNVYIYDEVLRGEVDLEGHVAIVGGGPTAIETALYLMDKNSEKCTLIEQLPRIGQALGWVRLINSMTQLHVAGIDSLINASVVELDSTGAHYSQDGEIKKLEADSIVIAVGATPNPVDNLKEKCEELGIPFHLIGDAKEVRLARHATAEGMAVALKM